MKKAYVTILCLALSLISFAQTSDVSIFVADTETNQPLPGATVYFEELEKGAITNFDGIATFTEIPNGNQAVKISYVGFRTIETTIEVGTKKEFFFKLESRRNELDEVVIQSSRSTRTVRKIPTRIEFIGVEELGEKAVMNPTNISMVLRESTGIQMQQTSLSSGNTNIRIQGLDGRYTQLLRDGFPLYGGFSSGLSILQIPPLDL
ncbi:MAG TPA: TonB-dependent receptor, partial [Aquaticitalea sp.]|nr:TonB-dependent receptor [Aquaticitalea sp.]